MPAPLTSCTFSLIIVELSHDVIILLIVYFLLVSAVGLCQPTLLTPKTTTDIVGAHRWPMWHGPYGWQRLSSSLV